MTSRSREPSGTRNVRETESMIGRNAAEVQCWCIVRCLNLSWIVARSHALPGMPLGHLGAMPNESNDSTGQAGGICREAMPSCCSEERNDPPDKPVAFVLPCWISDRPAYDRHAHRTAADHRSALAGAVLVGGVAPLGNGVVRATALTVTLLTLAGAVGADGQFPG